MATKKARATGAKVKGAKRAHRISEMNAEGVITLRVTGPGAARIRRARAELARMNEGPPQRGIYEVPARVLHRPLRMKDGNHVLCAAIPRTEVRLRRDVPPATIETRVGLRARAAIDRLRPLLAKAARQKQLSKDDRRSLELLEAEVASLTAPTATPSMHFSMAAPTPAIGSDEVTLYEAIESKARAMLADTDPKALLRNSRYNVKDATYYDFALYEFLVDPYVTRALNCNPISDLEALIQAARSIFWDAVMAYFPRSTSLGDYGRIGVSDRLQEFSQRMLTLFIRYVAANLYEFYSKLLPGYIGYSGSIFDDVLEALADFAKNMASRGFDPEGISSSYESTALWQNGYVAIYNIFAEKHPDANVSNDLMDRPRELPFTPFPSNEVNFGLRLVYRQEWEYLGTQPGEVVRTIPLGPKQSEKVSTKIVFRRKLTQRVETLSATEAVRETSRGSKDTDDIVSEASRAFNVHAEASGSGGIPGVFSASGSAGSSYDTAASSKSARSRLNEAMAKSSAKMRSETTVVVSTEREETREFTSTSEIANPNEEIAVTYVYSKLQRQYQLTTDLAEVASVAFVPMCMPRVSDIDEEWIREHAWILAKVLLDESFRADLELVAQEPSTSPASSPDTEGNKFGKAMDAVVQGIGEYKDFKGNLPDVFRVAQESYSAGIQEYRDRTRETEVRRAAIGKLQTHIVANILHYMRAIWRHDDPSQRLMRLGQVRVPAHWEFVASNGPDSSALTSAWEGRFLPDLREDRQVRLTELIDPSGPLDYVGNYAVYEIRGTTDTIQLHSALAAVRARYARFQVLVTNASALSVMVIQAVAIEPRYQSVRYRIYRYDNSSWVVWDDVTDREIQIPVQPNRPVVEFDGVLVHFSDWPAPLEEIWVDVAATPQIEDPELRFLRATVPLPTTGAECAAIFTADTVQDMKSWLTDEAAQFPSDPSAGWPNFSAPEQSALVNNYHQYLLVKSSSRRVLIDSDNLLLDLEVGNTPALEHYKRLSRLVDVLKELEQYALLRSDHQRRDARRRAGNLADPDIDHVSVIAGSSEVSNLIADLGK